MERLKKFQKALTAVMSDIEKEFSNAENSNVQFHQLIDEKHHRYQLLAVGWLDNNDRVFNIFFQADIANDKIWMQVDNNEYSVAERLVDKGISKKDIVTINPSADVVMGTQHFYQSYATEKKKRDSLLGIIPISGGGGSGGTTTTTVAKTSFDVLSYNFKLPLAYNRAHYVVEAAYQLSVLSSKAQTGAGKTNSFGTLSFYYQF